MLSIAQPVFIRFEDADPAGVVFYPRAIALAHTVVEELIRQSAIGWDAWFNSPTHAAPLRHAEADFLLPMKAGESFKAHAAVEKVGVTSVTFVVSFLDEHGRMAASIRTTHVTIDKASGLPVDIPENFRTALG